MARDAKTALIAETATTLTAVLTGSWFDTLTGGTPKRGLQVASLGKVYGGTNIGVVTATTIIEASDDQTATETIGTFPVIIPATSATAATLAKTYENTINVSTKRRYIRAKTTVHSATTHPSLSHTSQVDVVTSDPA